MSLLLTLRFDILWLHRTDRSFFCLCGTREKERNDMTRWILLLSLSLGFALPALAGDDAYQKLSRQGMELAYNLRFREASSIFDRLIQLDPAHPRGYLLQAVSLYYRYQLEENHQEIEQQFLDFSAKAIRVAKQRLRDKEDGLDALFYLGTAYMYRAAYYAWENSWLKAYWYGKAGIASLEQVVKRDSSYFDAYLGLGVYHYYTDILPKYVKPVTFILGIKSDREKGLAELELAATKGRDSRAEALLFLGSIYLYTEKDYSQALRYFQTLATRYPQNPTFLLFLGENYQKMGKSALAVETLQNLLVDERARQFPVLMASAHFRLGNVYLGLKRYKEAIEQYNLTLDYTERSTGNVRWAKALAHLNLGRSYDLLGERTKAVEHYKQVRKSDHKHAYALAQERLKHPLPAKATGSLTSKTFDEIIEVYREALAKTKANGTSRRGRLPELTYHIATALYERAAYRSAATKYERVLAMENVPTPWIKPWAHFYLGNCYRKLGEVEKAKLEYQQAYRFEDEKLRAEIERIRRAM